MGHAAFFGVMAAVAVLAGCLLRLLDPAVLRVEAANGSADQRACPKPSMLD